MVYLFTRVIGVIANKEKQHKAWNGVDISLMEVSFTSLVYF